MTTLVYRSLGEVGSDLFQELNSTKDQCIVHIRPRLFITGNPAGSLFLQVENQNDRIIATSNTVAISAISTAAHFHGHVRFDLNVVLQQLAVYRVRLLSSGYSFAESSHVGWVSDFDDRVYGVENENAQKDFGSPLKMEIFEAKTQFRKRNNG